MTASNSGSPEGDQGSALGKLNRADKHIKDMKLAVNAFMSTNPCDIAFDADPQSGQQRWYVRRLDSIPREIPLIFGDAVHCLRCALDHLVYGLVVSETGVSDQRSFFPISRDSEAHPKTVKDARIENLSFIDRIHALKPYRGGNDILWELHQLDNIDKHRTPVMLMADGSSMGFPSGHPSLSRLLPLENGKDVFPASHWANTQNHLDFAFIVALRESAVAPRYPVVQLLLAMRETVSEIITGLTTNDRL